MKKLSWTIFVVLLLLPVCAYTTPITKDFYTDGQIVDGNYFDEVDIWNTANVDMTGGEVSWFKLHDTGQLDLTSGTVSSLNAHNNSIIEMSNGNCGTVTISGSSIMYLSGGDILGWFAIGEDAVLHVYGKDFLYIPGGGYGFGWLSGHWVDNSDFTILFRNLPEPFPPESSVILHIIPEPCMLGLFGFGFLIVRRTVKSLRK